MVTPKPTLPDVCPSQVTPSSWSKLTGSWYRISGVESGTLIWLASGVGEAGARGEGVAAGTVGVWVFAFTSANVVMTIAAIRTAATPAAHCQPREGGKVRSTIAPCIRR